MKLKFLLHISLILVLSSCSLIYDRINYAIDPPVKGEKKESKQENALTCKTKQNNLVLASESTTDLEEFNQLFKNTRFSFIEKLTLFVLMHAYTRPNTVGPHSQIQILLSYKNQQDYIYFLPQDKSSIHSYSLFYSLERLLKKYGAKHSLQGLLRVLQSHHFSPTVTEEFNEFLEANIKDIQKSRTLRTLYMKGQQVLQASESMPKPNFIRSLNRFKKNKKSYAHKDSSHLFTKENDNQKNACNFDLNLYEKGIFIIQPNPVTNSLTLGISQGKKNSALVSITQNTSLPLSTFEYDFHFKLGQKPSPASFCILKQKKRLIKLVSNKGRDPSQILFNFINSKHLRKTDSSVHKQINAYRKIKLFLPERIVIESKPMSETERDLYINSDTPLYHAKNLGLIWAQETKKDQSTTFIDKRWQGSLLCPK